MTLQLNPKAVETIFAAAKSQGEYVVGLYKLVVPDWDAIETIEDYPVCSSETWCAIGELAMAWDRTLNASRSYRDQVMLGGAWMNSGFTAREGTGLALWEIRPPDEAKIRRKGRAA